MNRRLLSIVIATALLAGLAIAIVPQHALTIVRVGAVTVVAVAGALVLIAIAALGDADAPSTALDRPRTDGAPPLDPHGLRDARRDLDRPRVDGSIPTAVWERLIVATALRMQSLGIDIDSPRTRVEAQRRLRATTWNLLITPPLPGTVRDPAAVAAVVHRTLDELESLDQPTGAPHAQ